MKNNKRIYVVISILIMAFIFIQSSLPADLSDAESNWLIRMIPGISENTALELTFIVRKSAHFLEYTLLGLSLYLTFGNDRLTDRRWENRKRENRKWDNRKWKKTTGIFHEKYLPWLAGTLYAVTDELHQHFVPGRSCELRDVCIDSAGVLCGILCMVIYWRIRRHLMENDHGKPQAGDSKDTLEGPKFEEDDDKGIAEMQK